jgi:tetratricopeptide (TPR) repeat protein
MLELNWDPETLLKILCLRDCVLRDPVRTDERLANAHRVVQLSLQKGSYQALYIGLTARVACLAELGEFQQADFEADGAASAARLSGNRRYECGVLAYRAARSAMDGKLSNATESFEHCLAVSHAIEASELMDACWPAMILPFREMGRLGELQQQARAAVNRHPYEPVYRAMLAWFLAEQGDTHEAEIHLKLLTADDYALVDAAQDRLACMAALAEAFSLLKKSKLAIALYDRLLPYADRMATFGSCGFFGVIARYLGKLAGVLSRFDEGIQYLEDAIRLNDKVGARLWSVYSRFDLAHLLAERRGQKDAARALRLTASLYRDVADIGMPVLAERLETLQTDLITCVCESAPSRTERSVAEYGSRALLGSGEGQNSHTLSRFFRREGDYWTLGYDGASTRIKDIKGLKLLSHLLAHPGQRFHTVELELATERALQFRNNSTDSHLGPVLDSKAKQSYRARLSELQNELVEARDHEDEERVVELKREVSFFTRELARAVGLGGRDRNVGSEMERTRLRVTNAIRFAISRVSALHPVLGRHLQQKVITGNFCLYTAEPSSADWQF